MINFKPIKHKLESLKCSEHNEHPKVSYVDSKLSINCCCDNFRKIIFRKAKPLIEEETQKAIQNIFKKR